MEKKRVLFIVEAFGGGVFTYITELANALSNKYRIFIIYNIRPETPQDYKKYFNPSIVLIRLNCMKRSISIINDFQSLIKIKRIEKKIQPDIIHLHSSKAGALGRLLINNKSCKVFYTPHGYSFLMLNSGHFKQLLFKLVEALLAKRRCTTIACSPGEYKEALKLNRNARMVNNGINISKKEFRIKNYTLPLGSTSSKNMSIFTTGRISFQKNPLLFNKIALKFPNINFIWIGDGELRNKLTAPNIQITGWVSRKRAMEIAGKSNIFILVSLWEGLPMSLLESMYLGKICIASNVVGNNDVIKNNINGFLCDNFDEFIMAVRNSLRGDNKLTKKLVTNAHDDIVKNYTLNTMCREYQKIYKENFKN